MSLGPVAKGAAQGHSECGQEGSAVACPKETRPLSPPAGQDLSMKTELEAVNGKAVQALEVFAHALRFFRRQAVQVRGAVQASGGALQGLLG